MKLTGINPKIFTPINIKTKLGDCAMSIEKEDGRHNLYNIVLQNKQKKELGHESIEMDTVGNCINGFLIECEEEYRQKDFRFGEILRLGTIIELIENNMNLINIYAKKTAAIFHHKYKFKPNISLDYTKTEILHGISQDKHPDFKDISKRASNLLNNINGGDTNLLIEEYLTKIETGGYNTKEHLLKTALPMQLYSSDIFENYEFFNNLFKRHNIDYKI